MKNILKLFTPADISLIIILLMISTVMMIYLKSELTTQKVEVYFHNELIGTYSLNEPQLIYVDDGIVAEIADLQVRMKSNTCRHQYCVQQGWSDTLPVICVPNEVMIVIKSKKDDMLITR